MISSFSDKVAIKHIERRDSLVLDRATIRAIEHDAAHLDLMRLAGDAAADFLCNRCSDTASKIVLFVGPGNNGGDALACAAALVNQGFKPTVVCLSGTEHYTGDTLKQWQRVLEFKTRITVMTWDDFESGLSTAPQLHSDYAWAVDGLFGIGLSRPMQGDYLQAVAVMVWLKNAGTQILALDVPSGIDADTGAVHGLQAVSADHTLTFISLKPGVLTGPALDYVGEVHLAPLGISPPTAAKITAWTARDCAYADKPRLKNAHKGSQGTLGLIGGSNGMHGAALLAGRAAMRMGAGKVRIGWIAEQYPSVDLMMPELMMSEVSYLLAGLSTAYDSLVIGCGLGQSAAAKRSLQIVLACPLPVVFDADALNLIAQDDELAGLFKARRAGTSIITPHPTEAARLLKRKVGDVQNDRLKAARDLTRQYSCIAVLKGAGTVVDDGQTITINCTGNALLATAGTGDILAGMIGALIAGGHAPVDAARLGVAIHGMTADRLLVAGQKRAVASDFVAVLPYI